MRHPQTNSPNVSRFTYKGLARAGHAITACGGIAAIVACTLVAAFNLSTGIQTQSPIDGIVFGVAWPLVIGYLVGFGMINHFPTIWISEQGIEISAFLVKRIMVRWEDVIDVRRSGWPPWRYVLVRARRITPMHRVYGWMYSHTFYPAFVIDGGIERRDELLTEIQRHVASGSGVS